LIPVRMIRFWHIFSQFKKKTLGSSGAARAWRYASSRFSSDTLRMRRRRFSSDTLRASVQYSHSHTTQSNTKRKNLVVVNNKKNCSNYVSLCHTSIKIHQKKNYFSSIFLPQILKINQNVIDMVVCSIFLDSSRWQKHKLFSFKKRNSV